MINNKVLLLATRTWEPLLLLYHVFEFCKSTPRTWIIKLEPQFGSITIQTTKPVCPQIQGHRGFPSCLFPGGEAKVGCTTSESICSHSPLFCAWWCVCSVLGLSPGSALPSQGSVVRKPCPEKRLTTGLFAMLHVL